MNAGTKNLTTVEFRFEDRSWVEIDFDNHVWQYFGEEDDDDIFLSGRYFVADGDVVDNFDGYPFLPSRVIETLSYFYKLDL